jgi:hypothetical protein
MSEQFTRITLLFADEGSFFTQELTVPVSAVEGYDRLIDGLREDPAVLKKVHLDINRLAAAWVEDAK